MKAARLVVLRVFNYKREQETKTWMMPGCKNLVGRWTLSDRWAVILEKPVTRLKSTFAHSTGTASWSALMLILICIQPATCCSHGFIRWKRGLISNCNRSRLNLYSWGEYLFILIYMSQTKTPWAILVMTYSARSNKKCHWNNPMHNNVISVSTGLVFLCWRNNY